MAEINWTALTIFIVLFALITFLGFAAAQWRKGDLDMLHEWGLGGRRFGTVVTWFLIGGDLYTAYTFIAVPALAFGAGAIAFFAVPYTVIIYPILFLVFPRLWYVCHKHNYPPVPGPGHLLALAERRVRGGHQPVALAVERDGGDAAKRLVVDIGDAGVNLEVFQLAQNLERVTRCTVKRTAGWRER